uniref:type IV pilin protein n=1 Tax=Psychrobacter sp. TaxID=56811 RepID=UPI00159ABA4C|nr:type IV pilin protein [Psychrobacter sp.]QJS05948.1 PilE protein [Psychrobacter sp.]
MYNNLRVNPNNSSGFTLVELMVTVTIIAILAAIAVPSYQNYVKRANIKAAQTDLISLSLVFENHYQRNLSYPSSGYTSTNELLNQFSSWSISKVGPFSFSSEALNLDNGKGYTLIATAKESSNLKGCILKIDNTNKQTATTSCDGKTIW